MEEVEEQDIALLYLSRSGSSSTVTFASRLPSRQPSPTSESHAPIDGIGSLQVPLSPIKSPSLSDVRDTHSGLPTQKTVALPRSRTLSHLPRSDTARHVSACFEFERDRALRMSQWVLAFVIGKCYVFYLNQHSKYPIHSQSILIWILVLWFVVCIHPCI